MTAWLLVVLAVTATARLTRLLTADFITAPIRDRIARRFGDDGRLAYLSTCDYCTSIYVGGAVAAVTVAWGDNRVVQAVLVALTASMAAGLLARLDAA